MIQPYYRMPQRSRILLALLLPVATYSLALARPVPESFRQGPENALWSAPPVQRPPFKNPKLIHEHEEKTLPLYSSLSQSDNLPVAQIEWAFQQPAWRKGWFYGAAALLLAAIVYSFHRLRINHILATEKVRSRIARDLHDDMGSTLTSINIMSNMAQKSAARGDLDKTREFLAKIGESTTRMMESMDDIVWSINPLNDSTPRVIARMREFTTGVLEARGIGFAFTIDEKIYHRKLQLDNRHDFFMIYKETITNIAKYAQCTFADVRIQLRKGQLVLRVQDNGLGFNVQEAGDGDGLMNMQRRAYRMNGQFSIQSQLGKGTVVTLMFPTT